MRSRAKSHHIYQIWRRHRIRNASSLLSLWMTADELTGVQRECRYVCCQNVCFSIQHWWPLNRLATHCCSNHPSILTLHLLLKHWYVLHLFRFFKNNKLILLNALIASVWSRMWLMYGLAVIHRVMVSCEWRTDCLKLWLTELDGFLCSVLLAQKGTAIENFNLKYQLKVLLDVDWSLVMLLWPSLTVPICVLFHVS